jgi:hypothetical protein
VIGHQTESKQLNSLSFLRFSQEREKSFVVLWFVEYGAAPISTVDDVVGVTALLSSGNSWHEALLTCAASAFQRKSSLSPFLTQRCQRSAAVERLKRFGHVHCVWNGEKIGMQSVRSLMLAYIEKSSVGWGWTWQAGARKSLASEHYRMILTAPCSLSASRSRTAFLWWIFNSPFTRFSVCSYQPT